MTIHLSFLSVHLGRSTVFYYLRINFFYAVTVFIFQKFLIMQLQFQNFQNYLVMQLQFFFLPELILHKYSVEGYVNFRV